MLALLAQVPDPVTAITKYGWPGLCGILLIIMVLAGKWIATELLDAFKNNTVIMGKVNEAQTDTLAILKELRDWMLRSGKGG